MTGHPSPRLFGDLAGWFHLFTAPDEYREEADFYARVLRESCAREPRTVLELGSGGGNNASHMKERFDMTLVDLSPAMLDVSRSINPECEHLEGDMRTIRLSRTFDAVFVHDAVSYLLTAEELSAAISTAFEHLAPGGVALFVPDEVLETFEPRTHHGGHDGAGPGASVPGVELGPGSGRHRIPRRLRVPPPRAPMPRSFTIGTAAAVFPRDVWKGLLSETGFEPHTRPAEYEEGGEVFIGRKSER